MQHKKLNDIWQEFMVSNLTLEAQQNPKAVRDLKRAFFAGASHLLNQLTAHIDENFRLALNNSTLIPLPPGAMTFLHNIERYTSECRGFYLAVEAGEQ